ncbi:MAG: chemotaxis protein CheW [Cyanobacteria bacterium J06560_6]
MNEPDGSRPDKRGNRHVTSQYDRANTASNLLLLRSIPADYRAEQTAALAAPQMGNNHTAVCSLLIFRLAKEWFALSAKLCRQVLSPLTAHTLPHRSNDTLQGIVNVNGQMLLKVSLRSLLNLPAAQANRPTENQSCNQPGHRTKQAYPKQAYPKQAYPKQAYQRTIVLEKSAPEQKGPNQCTEVWVFDVDELDGIHSIALEALESPPVSVEASAATCTHRIFLWQGHRVSWLNDTRLFDALRIRAL